MNSSRMMILGIAALAAGAAVLLARGLLGGGTAPVKAALPPPPATREVLVAASDLQPGTALTADMVRWQQWPKSAVDGSFVTHDATPDLDRAMTGAVVRAPLVAGQPLTTTMIVRADTAGFMAAMLSPGMRAVAINITTESSTGGFVLPNDRVDVLLTYKSSESPVRYSARTILGDVRVLAVDQTFEGKDEKSILAKTATLELSPVQAELVERAEASGTLSLALRALGDSGPHAASTANNANSNAQPADSGPATVIRYGVGVPAGANQKD